ncbi:MAG: DEAD/DEAH box helicase [Deltaproteobacteria bacterium]|jgi:superfamily II RNA helicase|nr:DEAD/DEAH box helicase [Deltaproteobacteria bacterium]
MTQSHHQGRRRTGDPRRDAGERPARPRPKDYPDCTVEPGVWPHLNNIGQPAEAPFAADPFQEEAVRLVREYDVIVSAPTGSGKTWIAQKAMEHELSQDRRIWYTSPLKALSNSKFLEFGNLFGKDRVGLLTGDHKLNTSSPVIVGTTEILRNQLYDNMADGRDVGYDLVILDEAHYLGDQDRGVVWEEVLIYLPARVRLLLLSATIENADDLAGWIASIRGSEVKVVNGGVRPVPLIPLCLENDSLKLLSTAARREPPRRGRRGRGEHVADVPLELHLDRTLRHLGSLDLLPAIFFLKSRSDCNRTVERSRYVHPEPPERREARNTLIDEYLANHPYLANYHDVSALRNRAVAAHHAGNLPQFKFLVEELMSRGLLTAIFSTSTVSAGVNFPARTVVIPQSDRFNGMTFSDLTATELAQMTGRAGRRGRDLIGFAVILPGPYMNLKLMNGLFNSPPNPIISRLDVSFSMVLNLIQVFKAEDVKYLLARSLYAWQSVENKTERGLRAATKIIWESFRDHLRFLRREKLLDQDGKLTARGNVCAKLRFDHPLVYHEALQKGAIPASPILMASTIAGLIDANANVPAERRMRPPQELSQALSVFHSAVKPISERLRKAGFPSPSFLATRSWAVYEWMTSHDFTAASNRLGKDAGDLVRLLLLTVEYLNQFMDASEIFPGMADTIKEAQALLMVPPLA